MSQETPRQPVSPRASTTPLISSAQRDAAAQNQGDEFKVDSGAEDKDSKAGKRRFFGLGKKKQEKEEPSGMASQATSTTAAAAAAAPPLPAQPPATDTLPSPSPGFARSDLKPQVQPIPISPSRHAFPASPSRLRSASPRRHSPASSEIFERNVQEPAQMVQLQGELSPAHIPAHVITEDHIPPALEVAAQAITSEELNPDEVEIVMSTSHQPAASVLDGSPSQADLSHMPSPMPPLQHVRSDASDPASSMHQSGFLPSMAEEDGASSYGQLDPTDVRRLSFISFADVVQSEHQAPAGDIMGSRDNLHGSSFSPRSPTSTTATSGGVTTPPPPSVNVVASTLESSPPPSSVNLTGPVGPAHSELTIETMRQAVRKTASGDLSAGRSTGLSPVVDEFASSVSIPRSRTNS